MEKYIIWNRALNRMYYNDILQHHTASVRLIQLAIDSFLENEVKKNPSSLKTCGVEAPMNQQHTMEPTFRCLLCPTTDLPGVRCHLRPKDTADPHHS